MERAIESSSANENVVTTFSQLTSKLGNRAARLYWDATGPNSLSSRQSHSKSLENPFVAAVIAAGVIGVMLIAVLILVIWIRSKVVPKRDNANLPTNPSVVSSFSTLYEMEVFEDTPNVSQTDSPV